MGNHCRYQEMPDIRQDGGKYYETVNEPYSLPGASICFGYQMFIGPVDER